MLSTQNFIVSPFRPDGFWYRDYVVVLPGNPSQQQLLTKDSKGTPWLNPTPDNTSLSTITIKYCILLQLQSCYDSSPCFLDWNSPMFVLVSISSFIS
ncbi:uncharacterized protein DS421_3g84110 [Arachis hypogaea]|nr:uncharacterized protein DS421_3g84110 [Arachis hypogaea]